MTQVPNTQSFPDNAYPAQAYYGINSTLADVSSMSASGSAESGGNGSLMPTQTNMRGLFVAFLGVIGAVALWHYYYK